MKRILILSFVSGIFFAISAQDTLKNTKHGGYYFKVLTNIEATVVQDQSKTSTCWSFSSLSFFESELIRMGKGTHNLSEMFVVRNAYLGKAETYIRMNGMHNFGPGGAFHDVPWVIRRYGIMPESSYKGLNYGYDKHNHAEMDAVLKGIVDAVRTNPQGKLTNSWKAAFSGAIDAYLGAVPKNFIYQEKEYTPIGFAKMLGLNMDDYVSLTSFTHHPYYTAFAIEVPDNWAMIQSYNIPLNELESVAENALSKGYSWAWAADVSEKGFSYKNGIAIVPVNDTFVMQLAKDNRTNPGSLNKNMGLALERPMEEIQVNDSLRQLAFDNYQTTDDHGMHATGIVSDQNGKKYFKIKNSWGTGNDCGGYLYCSFSYFRYKTLNIFIHKNALPKDLSKKLGIAQN